MIAKVLLYKYTGESGNYPARVYLEKDFEQAELDLIMMKDLASSDRDWHLRDVELYKGLTDKK